MKIKILKCSKHDTPKYVSFLGEVKKSVYKCFGENYKSILLKNCNATIYNIFMYERILKYILIHNC